MSSPICRKSRSPSLSVIIHKNLSLTNAHTNMSICCDIKEQFAEHSRRMMRFAPFLTCGQPGNINIPTSPPTSNNFLFRHKSFYCPCLSSELVGTFAWHFNDNDNRWNLFIWKETEIISYESKSGMWYMAGQGSTTRLMFSHQELTQDHVVCCNFSTVAIIAVKSSVLSHPVDTKSF